MALSAGTVWEVRTTGNDLNGGGFVATGTDYSQQDSAQKSGADLAIHASTNTDVLPTAAGVSADDVGNLIQIASGTGWTAGFYEIKSIQGSYWRLDRSPSAAGNANLATYKMGGAMASPGMITGQTASSHRVYIKAGTYTITSATTNISGGCMSATASVVVGYSTNRTLTNTDTKPYLVLNAGVSSATMCGGTSLFINLSLDGASQTSSRGCSSAAWQIYAANFTNSAFSAVTVNCEAVGCSTQAACNSAATYFTVGHGNSSYSFTGGVFNVAYGNSVSGFGLNQNAAICCVSYGNIGGTSDGFSASGSGSVLAINCVAESNGRHGFSISTPYHRLLINCSTYGNASLGISGTGIQVGCIATAASVFVDAANLDFRLNSTANAGALLKSAGWAGWPNLHASMASYPDIGAVQHADPALTYPTADKIYSGQTVVLGGVTQVTGTLHASNISTAAGSGEDLSSAILLTGHTVDDVVGSGSGGGGFVPTVME
jgi:hypothetical protein